MAVATPNRFDKSDDEADGMLRFGFRQSERSVRKMRLLIWGNVSSRSTACFARISQFVNMNKLVHKISIKILQILSSLRLWSDSTEFAYVVCLLLNNSSRFRRFGLPTSPVFRQIPHHARYGRHKLLNRYHRWLIKWRSSNIISFLSFRSFNDFQIREQRKKKK